jgi:hypothetical protein
LESGFERLEYVDYLNEVHSSGSGQRQNCLSRVGALIHLVIM